MCYNKAVIYTRKENEARRNEAKKLHQQGKGWQEVAQLIRKKDGSPLSYQGVKNLTYPIRKDYFKRKYEKKNINL